VRSAVKITEVVRDAEGWAALGRPRDHQSKNEQRYGTPRLSRCFANRGVL